MGDQVSAWPLEEAVSRAGWRGWVKRIDKIPDVFGNLTGKKTSVSSRLYLIDLPVNPSYIRSSRVTVAMWDI